MMCARQFCWSQACHKLLTTVELVGRVATVVVVVAPPCNGNTLAVGAQKIVGGVALMVSSCGTKTYITNSVKR